MAVLDWLQDQIEAVVRTGGEVRDKVATVVAAAAQGAGNVTDGFAELLRSTITGAARAVDDALPDPDGRLRQVVDGVGDGLAMAAHAAELALRESGGDTARRAGDEIERLGHAFRGVPERFVTGVRNAAMRAGGHAADVAEELARHAAATLRRVGPPLAQAADALREHPLAVGHEAVTAGAAAARGAAGAFLEVMGRQLQAMGVALAPRRDRES